MTFLLRSRVFYIVLVTSALFAGLFGYALKAKPKAPEVTFTLLSGQSVTSHALRDKVYGVHFWSTSCSTCIQEMPALIKLYEHFHPQGLEWIAVAMQGDPKQYVSHYSQTHRLPFMVALDHGDLAAHFGNVALTPTTFIIDKKGRILKTYVGIPDFNALSILLAKALAS
jgi:peroxiredoxin